MFRGQGSGLRPAANNHFLPILAALILGGFSMFSLLSYLKARDLMDRQISGGTLPLTSDTIIFRLEQTLLRPMLASGLMGGNNFIEDSLIAGEKNPVQLQDYLARIQQKTGAVTTFLVSDRSQLYYHPNGIIKRISSLDPQDRWYYRFRTSGKTIEINIDRDTADLNRSTAFINVPLRDRGQRFLGTTGLGLDLRDLQSELRHYQSRYGARILLVDPEGTIKLSSDQTSGSLHRVDGLGASANRILAQASSSEMISERGRKLYVRSNRIPEVGWTLVVIQQRTAEQSAFIDLLAQNLLAAVLISLILVSLAQLTLGREQQRLQTLARTDLLSGLFNRSVFESLFDHLVAQAQALEQPLAIALMDIDHFKAINDDHGHPVGDAVIRHVSRRVQASVAANEPLFRWGGEEFLLLLPGCDLERALERLEAIRRELSSHPFVIERQLRPELADQELVVTLSFGLTLHGAGETSSEVLQRADRALYGAKRKGRDCICVGSSQTMSQLAS